MKIIKLKKNKYKETKLLKLNTSKTKNKLNYNPILNINETINYTALWYKKYFEKNTNLSNFTNMQIKNYLDKIKV